MNRGEIIRLSKTVRLSTAQNGEKILDLGAHDCRLRNFLPKCDYTGIDAAPKVEGIIRWDLESGLPPQVLREKFDLIFMNEFIEHVENFKTLLTQCRKIISDKGRIVISTPSPSRFIVREDPTHIHCFRKTNMKNLAKICGLRVTKCVGTYITISILKRYIPTNQTFYSEVLIYRLELEGAEWGDVIEKIADIIKPRLDE